MIWAKIHWTAVSKRAAVVGVVGRGVGLETADCVHHHLGLRNDQMLLLLSASRTANAFFYHRKTGQFVKDKVILEV